MQRIRKETIIGGDVPRMHCLSDLYKWNESKQIQYLNTKTQTQTQQTRKGEGQVFPSWERDTHWPTTAGGESWKRGGEAPLIKHKRSDQTGQTQILKSNANTNNLIKHEQTDQTQTIWSNTNNLIKH